MKTIPLLFGSLLLVGCSLTSIREPGTTSYAEDAQKCEGEAAAASYPSALAMPTPAERSYPWTAGRDWRQYASEERLRDRDIFESCMAERGHPVVER